MSRPVCPFYGIELSGDCQVCGAPIHGWASFCCDDCMNEMLHNRGKYVRTPPELVPALSAIGRYIESLSTDEPTLRHGDGDR